MRINLVRLIAVLLLADVALTQCTPSVNYEQFGAKGDGIQDDMPAIVAAHNAANEKGRPVKVTPGKTYYIGGRDLTAIIKTNTDWGDARFIIDDRDVENIKQYVFVVEASRPSFDIYGVDTLHRGQSNLGVTLPSECLVEVEDNRHRVYIREGLNQDGGKDKAELFVVQPDGSIREDSGIVWDFDHITRMTAYPLDKKGIIIKGGVFTTIANNAPSKYTYYNRGISIQRSHVVLEGLEHYITGEGSNGAPYASFVGTRYAADVLIHNCTFTAHKTYSTIGSAGRPVMMGSYDVQALKSINVLFENCTQTTDIDNNLYWGLFASNFCKTLSMNGCRFSRFDAHLGVRDVTLKGCTFGYQGVRMVGFGTMRIEDCEVRCKDFVHLRSDYGSSWDGAIIIRNCRYKVMADSLKAQVISGKNSGMHDFGYNCCLPERIEIENMEIDDSAVIDPAYEGPVLFGDFERSPEAVFPFPARGKISVRGITVKSGKEIRLADKPENFALYTFSCE